jgi:hypothetical protein
MSTSMPEIRKEAWNKVLSLKSGDFYLPIPSEDIIGIIPEGLRGGRLLSNGSEWNVKIKSWGFLCCVLRKTEKLLIKIG